MDTPFVELKRDLCPSEIIITFFRYGSFLPEVLSSVPWNYITYDRMINKEMCTVSLFISCEIICFPWKYGACKRCM